MGGEKAIALLPETFMNESGRAVAEAHALLQDPPRPQVVVFHDELDLPPAKVRVKKGGGNAGHNGLKSITALCGNEYWRVRLGIGHPGDKALVHAYVLNDFGKSRAGLGGCGVRPPAPTSPTSSPPASGRRNSRTAPTFFSKPRASATQKRAGREGLSARAFADRSRARL